MQTYQASTLTINFYKIATKAEWNQWNRTESLDAHVHQWREVGLQTGRDRPEMRLGQLFVHTSGDIFRFLSHNTNKNNFQVD